MALLVLCAAYEPFPADPRGSLEQALERGTLRVGVVEASPWVTNGPSGSPGGVEAELVSGFAGELGIDVEWHWASADDHLEALSRYELDVVAGGLTASNPWSKHVGLTGPYFEVEDRIGLPAGVALPGSLEDVTVAVLPAAGLRAKLEERGAIVREQPDLAGAGIPVAAPRWRLEGMNLRLADITLRRRPHVMAVPQGENRLLVHLEDYLRRHAEPKRIRASLWSHSQR